MRKRIFVLLVILNLSPPVVLAVETCSREAIINYQSILVDTNSTQKGEGLRFYLQKDQKALAHLNDYQSGTEITWKNAILGTAGTGLIISTGFLDTSSKNKNTIILAGISMIAINFLIARTLEFKNEDNLQQAIQEYNKRNLPKINFRPISYHGKRFFETSLNITKAF